MRWRWAAAIGVVGLAFLAVLLAAGESPPPQPIRFSHALHVKQAKCAACHQYVTKAANAGTPRLADCLDCHEGTQSKTPEGKREEAKLDRYAGAKQEIPWLRVTGLQSHAYFSHQRHVAIAKLECATCHGNIAQTDALPARPAVALTMDFCVSCHQKRKATVDCLACHR